MDILYLLQRRITFLRTFYDRASHPFAEIQRQINNQEPPFDTPPANDSEEPAYLEEWQDAEEGLEMLGQMCLTFLSTSLKLYLHETTQELHHIVDDRLDPISNAPKRGFLKYEHWFRRLHVLFDYAPVSVELIREIIETRNLIQHPESIRRVLAIKRAYEHKYPSAYFVTKRGEEAPADRDQSLVVDLLDMGKYLMAWHSQRPNVSYSENKIFDKHFEQLFKRNTEYPPENVHALHHWMKEVKKRWEKDNPLGLNESLLAMRAYAPYHHLYAVSLFFCQINRVGQGVPTPAATLTKATEADLVGQLVDSAGACLNSALEAAANEPQPTNRVFSPQNWIKTKTCLAGIRQAIGQYLIMLPAMPGATELNQKLRTALRMHREQFEDRWAAD